MVKRTRTARMCHVCSGVGLHPVLSVNGRSFSVMIDIWEHARSRRASRSCCNLHIQHSNQAVNSIGPIHANREIMVDPYTGVGHQT